LGVDDVFFLESKVFIRGLLDFLFSDAWIIIEGMLMAGYIDFFLWLVGFFSMFAVGRYDPIDEFLVYNIAL